jgi:hypothetical protein
MLAMLGEQPACYGQRSCIHASWGTGRNNSQLSGHSKCCYSQSAADADSAVKGRDRNGTTLFCYFWQYPGNAHISTINRSRGLVRRLSRWRPGSPWSGRGSVPGGRFHERVKSPRLKLLLLLTILPILSVCASRKGPYYRLSLPGIADPGFSH